MFMEKSLYLGFAVIGMSEIIKFETNYDTFDDHFGENTHFYYKDTGSFHLRMNTNNIIKDWQNTMDSIRFCHEILSKKSWI